MKYEVRYLINENEHVDLIDVENAAEAAARVQEQHLGAGENFELIQVHLIDEDTENEPVGETAGALD